MFILMVAALFVWPLFFQGVHVFTHHHDQIDCGTCCGADNQEDEDDEKEGCKICTFHFALFDQTKNTRLTFAALSYPIKTEVLPQKIHLTAIKFSYLLRAPPLSFVYHNICF